MYFGTIKKSIKNRINAVENTFWLRCYRVTLQYHIITEKIKEMVNIRGLAI